jgi:4-amino-4-deoxy-L-arabinose transferase-like glycosyltransferase
MLQRDDFITPYLNGAPRFEKPILIYWLQASTTRVFGDTEFAARLPSALAGIGSVFLLYLLAREIATRQAALFAALVLATMFRFVTFARMGLTDVPVVFFIVAALYAFTRAVRRPTLGAIVIAWIAVGLGVLTKGPVGLLPIVIWAVYAALERDLSLFIRVRPLTGIAVLCGVALPWYVVMIAEHGRPFVDFALGHEMFERVLSEASFAPSRGVLYNLKVLPRDAAPRSVLFVACAAWTWYRWATLDRETRQALVLAFAWFLSVFVAFSLSRSKVPHYVLPAYPAAALLIGVAADRLSRTALDSLWWRVPMTIVALVSAVAAVVTALFLSLIAPDATPAVRLAVPSGLMLGACVMGWATIRDRLALSLYAVSGMLAMVFAAIAVLIVPRIIEPYKPMPRLAREAARVAQPGATLGLLGRYGISSVVYYSRRHVRPLDDDEQTAAFFAGDSRALCVMPLADFERLAPRLHGAGVIAMAEEFDIRIERVLERRKAAGRQWVLVGRGGAVPPAARALVN